MCEPRIIIDKSERALQGTALLAKLSAGDIVSKEPKYPADSIIYLDNMASRQNWKSQKESQESVIHGIVFDEIMQYNEGTRSRTDIWPIFKLADRVWLYSKCLEKFGVVMERRIDTTHLKKDGN